MNRKDSEAFWKRVLFPRPDCYNPKTGLRTSTGINCETERGKDTICCLYCEFLSECVERWESHRNMPAETRYNCRRYCKPRWCSSALRTWVKMDLTKEKVDV